MANLVQTESAVNRGLKDAPTYPRAYIHYSPERVDYAVTTEELRRLVTSGQNSWKEFCLVCASVGVPCVLNAVALIGVQATFSVTLPIFLNSLIGALGVSLAICFGVLWRKTSKVSASVVEEITERPRLELVPHADRSGQLSYSLDLSPDVEH